MHNYMLHSVCEMWEKKMSQQYLYGCVFACVFVCTATGIQHRKEWKTFAAAVSLALWCAIRFAVSTLNAGRMAYEPIASKLVEENSFFIFLYSAHIEFIRTYIVLDCLPLGAWSQCDNWPLKPSQIQYLCVCMRFSRILRIVQLIIVNQ